MKTHRHWLWLPLIPILALIRQTEATEFEPLGKSVAAALGTTKAFKKTMAVGKEKVDVFYSKDAKGKADKLAIVQKGIYEPNCTHTWVVGMDAKKAVVEQVRVVEMSCPHAFPTKSDGFLGQYKGKGAADVAKLSSDVTPIAKATGTSNLTTDAVKKSIRVAGSLKGKL